MPLQENKIKPIVRSVIAAVNRIRLQCGRDEDLAAERAVYAEIGRIAGIPFSVSNVYKRFANQVSKIIPFDLILITQLDLERDTFTVMFSLGTEVIGLGQGKKISLADSAVEAEVASSKRAMRTDHYLEAGTIAQSLDDAGLLSRIATPLIANERVVGTLRLSSSKANSYGSEELARLEIVGNQIAGAIASGILLQAERDRASQLKSLYDVAAIITKPLSFEVKTQRIVDELLLISDADRVVLRRADEKLENLHLVASAGSGSIEFTQVLKITDPNLITLRPFLQGDPVLINDYQTSGDQPNLLVQGVESM